MQQCTKYLEIIGEYPLPRSQNTAPGYGFDSPRGLGVPVSPLRSWSLRFDDTKFRGSSTLRYPTNVARWIASNTAQPNVPLGPSAALTLRAHPYLLCRSLTLFKETAMSVATKTEIAIILRQYNQGLLTRSEAYHRISEVYYNLHSH